MGELFNSGFDQNPMFAGQSSAPNMQSMFGPQFSQFMTGFTPANTVQPSASMQQILGFNPSAIMASTATLPQPSTPAVVSTAVNNTAAAAKK